MSKIETVNVVLIPRLSSSCLDSWLIDVPVYDFVLAHSLAVVRNPRGYLEVVCLKGRAG